MSPREGHIEDTTSCCGNTPEATPTELYDAVLKCDCVFKVTLFFYCFFVSFSHTGADRNESTYIWFLNPFTFAVLNNHRLFGLFLKCRLLQHYELHMTVKFLMV